jgi:hypothetical protein
VSRTKDSKRESGKNGEAAATPPPRRPPTKKKSPGGSLKGSLDAKRKASLILETLSGLRSTADASAALGVTLARYYQLESRALQGLVDALEPRPNGGQVAPEVETRKLKQERDRLEQELRRAQALVRVAQRAVGLPPPQPVGEPSTGDGKRSRRRRVEVRTKRAMVRFRLPETATDAPVAPEATAQPPA